MTTQILTPPRKIKTLARKLRLTASHRRELTDHDVAELIVVVGPDRLWRVFDRITEPPRFTAAE
ncbi:MAG: hypothetical protein WA397_27310 [Roseiarcus sp.]